MSDFDKKRVYLDHNATTVPRDSALKAVQEALKSWGIPVLFTNRPARAKDRLWSAREALSAFLNCHPLEIIFTSGASESNNQAIKGLFEARLDSAETKRRELLISSVEHPSVLEVADFLAQRGLVVHKIPVSREGFLDEDFFDQHLSEKTLLVSVMGANNETGIKFPLEELIQKAHQVGAYFHSDMVQLLGKQAIDLKALGLDMASFSGHKFYSLSGCGILYCKKGIPLGSLIHGGPQERQRRAGTENLSGISALSAVAKEEGAWILEQQKRIQILRDGMEQELLSVVKDIEILGQKAPRLDNSSCLLIHGVQGETLLMNLDLKGFSISVGSACGSGKMSASSVLTAMGLSPQEAKSCIRVSLGVENTRQEIQDFTKCLISCIKRLRTLE